MIADLRSTDIELAVARHYSWRHNLIVPNVYWGLGLNHEADLLVVTKKRYATEVEIKISLGDLRRDSKKNHRHHSEKIKFLYFAIPEQLEKYVEEIDSKAGVLVYKTGVWSNGRKYETVTTIREAKRNKTARPLTGEEYIKLLELGSMRIWSLKEKLSRLQLHKSEGKPV